MGRSNLARGMGRRTQLQISASRKQAPVELKMTSPWSGYIPDVNAKDISPTAMEQVRALISRGGFLTTDDGWERVDPDNLPLGHNGDAFGFNNATDTIQWGEGLTGAATAGNDVIQPIVGVFGCDRYSKADGQFGQEALAVTGNTSTIGTGEPPFQESGHLFRYSSAGDWTSVEFRSREGEIASDDPVSGSTPLLADDLQGAHIAAFEPGVTGGDVGAPTWRIHDVPETTFIICNGVDQVMYYPDDDTDGGTLTHNYSDFLSYATQCQNAANNATFGVPPTFTKMVAASCAAHDGRVVYFNTVEDDEYFPLRVRISKAGNPLVVWPSFEIADTGGTGLLFNGVGADSMDLDEFCGEGHRVEPLGNVLACYASDGLAFLRRTGNPIRPYSRQYITFERGTLGRGCVANFGGGLHFAIMTDGWWLVGEDGTFREVGLIGDESSLIRAFRRQTEADIIYKWKDDFYGRLNQSAASTISIDYDPQSKFVRIAAPMDGADYPNEIWNYDIQSDRVWLDDWTGINGADRSARCWGRISRTVNTAVTWDGSVGVDWDDEVGTWDDLRATFSPQAIAHGDGGGFVYVHDPVLTQYDGVDPVWRFILAWHHYGQPHRWKTQHQVWVEYEASVCQSASFVAVSEDGVSGATVNLARESVGVMAVDHADFRTPGLHHKLIAEGTGRPKLHSLTAHFIVEGDGALGVRAEGE